MEALVDQVLFVEAKVIFADFVEGVVVFVVYAEEGVLFAGSVVAQELVVHLGAAPAAALKVFVHVDLEIAAVVLGIVVQICQLAVAQLGKVEVLYLQVLAHLFLHFGVLLFYLSPQVDQTDTTLCPAEVQHQPVFAESHC